MARQAASGQKNACGAIEQKNRIAQEYQQIPLHSGAQLENKKMLSAEPKDRPNEEDRMQSNQLP
jgi:hypothetical protein